MGCLAATTRGAAVEMGTCVAHDSESAMVRFWTVLMAGLQPKPWEKGLQGFTCQTGVNVIWPAGAAADTARCHCGTCRM